MPKLDEFFAPLGLKNIFVFLAFVSSCEIIGFALTRTFIKKTPEFLRGAIWLLGFGLVIFLYFLFHFFRTFAFPTIAICLVILLMPSFYVYLKEKGWKTLFLFLRHNFLPFLLLLPIIPLVFIKCSLPPHIWDEMAYHYISPYTLYHEKIWNFGTGVFSNFPRLMETGFIALFSLTKTYANARLLHFSIFVTSLIVIYSFLKENFGRLTALLYFLLMAYHGENLLLRATSGYVDVGAASLTIIGLFCFLSFLFGGKIETIIAGFAFLGMAAGIKYSTLIPLFSSGTLILFLMFKRNLFNNKYLNSYLVGLILFILLGGYWYIKNFIHTGNPIYPLLNSFFSCHFAICPSIVPAWTDPFSLSRAKNILLQVLGGNEFLSIIFLSSIPLSFFHPEKKVRKIAYFVGMMIIIELLLVPHFFRYESRFFYHWQFLSILFLVLPTALIKINRKIYLIFTLFLVFFTIKNSVTLIDKFYEEEKEPTRGIEIQYALGRINIIRWIKEKFPRMQDVIFWCDQNLEVRDLIVFDPSLIWFSSEGLFRIFMTNCNLVYITSKRQALLAATTKNRWVASLQFCNPEIEGSITEGTENIEEYLGKINNKIICESEMVLTGLYKFPKRKIEN